jgi:glucose-6-phosphate dehydrogenase assembly protein OpcA
VAPPVSNPGVPVVLHDLGAVEGELERLWQANAAPADGQAARAVLRAATFNLIAIVPSEPDADRACAVLGGVTAQYPGRALIVDVEPDATPPGLEAWVAMHCRGIDGAVQVCGEQIVIRAAGDAADRVGGALASLVLPDCPVVLWWQGGPGPAGVLLDRLAPTVDAVMLDGARFTPETLPRWVARARHHDTTAVGDFAWERGAPWRGWTADGFEPRELRASLGRIRAVSVECGEKGEMTGLLYVAWLASRLGWRPAPGLARSDGTGWAGTLAGPEGTVAVTLHAGGPGADLCAATLEADDMRCALTRESPECGALTVTRGPGVALRGAARVPATDEVRLVGRWLEAPRWDPLYGDALAALAAICLPGADSALTPGS